MRIDAAGLERGQHGIAAQQRNLALARIAAEHDGGLAEVLWAGGAALGGIHDQQAHAGSPTMRTSVRSTMPWAAATLFLHVQDQRLDVGGRAPGRD